MRAFVMMPFEDEFNAVYEDLVRPALESAGYDVERGDTTLDQQNILADIVRGISGADLLVADLTTLNPNVFYELGIAHGLRKPCLLIAQSIDELPFDIRSYRVTPYETRFDKAPELAERLAQLAKEHREGRVQFGNPVSDFAPDPGPVNPTVQLRMEPDESTGDELQEEGDEPGFLDAVEESGEALEQVRLHMEQLTELVEQLGGDFRLAQEQVEASKASGAAGGTAELRRTASELAQRIRQWAEDSDQHLPALQSAWELVYARTAQVVSQGTITDDGDREALRGFQEVLGTFQESMGTALEGARNMLATAPGMKSQTRELTRAAVRMERFLQALVEQLEVGQAYVARLEALASERLRAQAPPGDADAA